MSLVQMKCPNCGGMLGVSGNQFSCSHCGTIILNIAEQQIDSDITTISVEEFTQKLQAAKNQFVIHLDEKVQVFDVNTAVTNKKIDDARALLAGGYFRDVSSCLNGVASDVLPAERLRFLAHYEVRSEEELMFDAGRFGDSYFTNIIRRCDLETKKTYLKIQEVRVENERIANEIKEGYRLLDVQLYKEALIYANRMCQMYPYKSQAWIYMGDAKHIMQVNYIPEHEQEMMKYCPDYKRLAGKLSKKPQESMESKERPEPELCGTTTFGFEIKCAQCGKKVFIDMASFHCPFCQHEITNWQIDAQIKEKRNLIFKNQTKNEKKWKVTQGAFYFLSALLGFFAFEYGWYAIYILVSGVSSEYSRVTSTIRIAVYVFMALTLIVTLVIQCIFRQKGNRTLHWTSSSREYNLKLLAMNIALLVVAMLLSIIFS